MNAIELTLVDKAFDGKPVLTQVSHRFAAGSVCALTGPSGAGKTTLLNIIMGLLKPDSGQVLGTKGLRVGAVFQEDRLLETQDALGNVRLVSPRTISDADIGALLTELGLHGEGRKPALEYSGGMRRRLALARALIVRPQLLILDEPFKGLDAALRKQAIEAIQRHRNGATTILVSHDAEDARWLGADDALELAPWST